MLKRLLLLIVSLLPFLCIGQLAAQDLTQPAFTGSDSNKVIHDLSSSIKEFNKVLLTWRIADSSIAEFVSIERSSNGNAFEVVGVLKISHQSSLFEWIDDAPAIGRNNYRISYMLKEGKAYYSSAIPVLVVREGTFKFYPNPVENILIIRSNTPLEIIITDGTGKIRVPATKVSGLQTINVSSLEKGVYLLRINNKLTNSISQEKLIKN